MWMPFTDLINSSYRKTAVLIAVTANIIYIAVLFPLYRTVGPQAAALVIVPLIISTWLLGFKRGLLDNIFFVFVHLITFYIIENDYDTAFSHVMHVGTASTFATVIVVGGLRNLVYRIQFQAYKIKKEHQALQSEIAERKRAESESEELKQERQKLRIEIAERKRVELELVEINKELDRFAYIVSHDLKAPLRGIRNLSDWIAEDMGDDLPEDVRKYLNLMHQSVQQMRNLIDGILDYSRIGRTHTLHTSVNTKELLTEVIESLQPPPQFNIAISDNMPILFTEEIRLKQVFSNLLSNAIKYHNHDDGHIRIDVETDHDFCTFMISDDGPGIPKEYHKRIFGLFETVNITPKKESTGIGLAITQKIVEDNRGKIWVESTIGNGATFYFTWPYKHK